ncbi:hypothetical protein B5D80_08530 [Micromonospora wenchangensis]|uniref:Uncharacterized protein n=1 Tax=Micromonospora wenchangensis TaxID=1185415 RepID=A0A246RQ29_9ACTN|nr:hypothetical protein B5D80_08530 [Micromonospora wenchangensis]
MGVRSAGPVGGRVGGWPGGRGRGRMSARSAGRGRGQRRGWGWGRVGGRSGGRGSGPAGWGRFGEPGGSESAGKPVSPGEPGHRVASMMGRLVVSPGGGTAGRGAGRPTATPARPGGERSMSHFTVC